MDIYITPTADIDLIWPDYARGLEYACRRGNDDKLTAGVLWQMCRSGHAFFVVCEEFGKAKCVSVWRFETPNEPQNFRCLALYGNDMRSWIKELPEFAKNIAKMNGGKRLVISGRSTWLRLFKDAQKIDNNYILELK
jgi:hypothetical protein